MLIGKLITCYQFILCLVGLYVFLRARSEETMMGRRLFVTPLNYRLGILVTRVKLSCHVRYRQIVNFHDRVKKSPREVAPDTLPTIHFEFSFGLCTIDF